MDIKKGIPLLIIVLLALFAVPTAFVLRWLLGSNSDTFGLWYLFVFFCGLITAVPHLMSPWKKITCPVCSLGAAIHQRVRHLAS